MHRTNWTVRSFRGRVALLALGCVVVGVACKKKDPPSPPVKEPVLAGLSVGMTRKAADDTLKAAGLQSECEPARNVTYSTGDALHTRWVTKGAAKRFKKTAGGYKRKSANKSHILTKMTTKRKRQLRGTSMIHKSDEVLIDRMLRAK